jgi:hypothetical protein
MRYAAIALGVLLLIYIVLQLDSCSSSIDTPIDQTRVPDTARTYKDYKPVRIPPLRITPPREVTIHQRPDSVRRKKVERDTLVGSVRYRTGRLEVEQLTPTGVSLVNTYTNLPDYVTAEIDSEGKVTLQVDEKKRKREKRKKTIIKVGTYLLIGAGAYTAFKAGQAF